MIGTFQERARPRRGLGLTSGKPRYYSRAIHAPEGIMSWKKPKIVEIAVGTEINAYACATR
jgi:coenzyme PQQ precursor peptide PqqA